MELMRNDGDVTVRIKGWNNTHVLFDMLIAGEKAWVKNMSRPILPFMTDYGLA